MVYDFALYNGELIVAGSGIKGWNGSTFHDFSSGTNGTVFNVVVHNQTLCIGGDFQTAGGLTVNHVGLLRPVASWQPLGGGTDNSVQDLLS